MSILVLTMLCVYVHYNTLGLYIKLFAWYKNIFLMKVIKTENQFKTGFQQLKSGFPKTPVLTSILLTWFLDAESSTINEVPLNSGFVRIMDAVCCCPVVLMQLCSDVNSGWATSGLAVWLSVNLPLMTLLVICALFCLIQYFLFLRTLYLKAVIYSLIEIGNKSEIILMR